MLNQNVKTNAVGRRRPARQQELIDKVRSYLWATPRKPNRVRRYFQEAHVRYAAV